MSSEGLRSEKNKIIHVASSKVGAGKHYLDQQNKQLLQNTKVILDTIAKLKTTRRA